jgi:hypothetical protein
MVKDIITHERVGVCRTESQVGVYRFAADTCTASPFLVKVGRALNVPVPRDSQTSPEVKGNPQADFAGPGRIRVFV